jgi:hypothetical protein
VCLRKSGIESARWHNHEVKSNRNYEWVWYPPYLIYTCFKLEYTQFTDRLPTLKQTHPDR